MRGIRSIPRPSLGRSSRIAIAVVAAGSLALSACAKSSDGGSGSSSGGSTLKLGVIVAKTGPIAGAGATFANGGQIAADEINAGNLIGNNTKISLETKEGSEDPAKSASVAAQLVADKSVTGIVCCILSTVAGAVTPITTKAKVPTMLWGATDENLAKPPYVFRTVTMPQPANEKMAQTLATSKKLTSVAYGVMTDNSGIVSQAASFKSGMDKAGVKDLGQVGTLSTQTDFTASATSLISKNAAAIVVVGTQSNAVGLIAALHDKGYKGLILSGETISGAGVYKSQPQALEPVPFPVYFLASTATGAAKTFADDYKKKYGTDADDYAAQGFNAVWTMAMAAKAAGKDVTRASLATALGNLKSLSNTIYGTVTFTGGQLDASSSVQIVHYTAPDGVIAPYSAG